MTLLDLDAVTIAGYRIRTGDTTSASGAVSAALLEAEQLLEEELRRHLALEERTESLKIYPDGRVFPTAWPITDPGDLVKDGRALIGGVPDGGPLTALVAYSPPPRSTVTYTGGFDANTLPVTLEHAIYDLAHAVVGEVVSTFPVGADSASVGDVSISGAGAMSGNLDSLVPGLSTRVARYRNRWI